MPSFSSSELSATHCYCCSMMSRWSGSELLCLTTLRTKYSRNTSTATPFWVVGVKGGKWSPKSRQIYTLRDGILRYIVQVFGVSIMFQNFSNYGISIHVMNAPPPLISFEIS
ncbi:hypothetical protein ACQJBY_036935 [Aegilops geniculata]